MSAPTLIEGGKQNYLFVGPIKQQSKVYLVQGVKDGQLYCLKKIAKEKFYQYKGAFDTIMTQYSNDPHILQLCDYFETRTESFIILEFCEGGDIMTLIKNNLKLDEEAIKNIILQVGDQIEKIHKNNYFYINLKPDIIVQKKQEQQQNEYPYFYKICDFKSLITQYQLQNMKNEEVSTRTFGQSSQAPEILNDNYNISFATDIWSFGLTIFEIMTNQKLFKSANYLRLCEDIDKFVEDQREIHKIIDASTLDEQVQKYLKQMIDPDPRKRPQISKVNSFFQQYFIKRGQQNLNQDLQQSRLANQEKDIKIQDLEAKVLNLNQEIQQLREEKQQLIQEKQQLIQQNQQQPSQLDQSSYTQFLQHIQMNTPPALSKSHRSTIFLTKASVLNIIQEIENKHQINAEEQRQKISQFLDQDKACQLSKTFEDIEKKINGIRQETSQILQQTNQLSNNEEIKIYDTQTQEVQQICKALLELKKKILSFGKK